MKGISILIIVFFVCTATKGGKCPISHPYAYFHGGFCCKTNQENTFENDSECNGGELTISSTCCEGGQHVKCENKPCKSRGSSCPSSHPYAYLHGGFCCKTNRENNFENNPECNGGVLTINSTCCEKGQNVKCHNKPCKSRGECPTSHPYAYHYGAFCCKTNQENTFENDPECNGGELTISSTCCESRQHIRCDDIPCNNNKGTSTA